MNNIKHIKNANIILLLILLSGTFLVGLNKYLSPIYFIFLISVVVFYANIIYKKKITKFFLYIILYIAIPIIIILLIQNHYLGLKYGLVNELGRHIVPLIYLGILSYFLNNKNINIKQLSFYYIKFNLIILIIELSYRLILTILHKGLVGGYYTYKFESLLYPDSNFVSLQIVSLYFFIRIFSKYYGDFKYIQIYKFILFTLLFFTFSRTAYIILIIYFLFKFILNYKKSQIRFFFTILSVFLLILIIPYVINTLMDDGSFKTKLYIFTEFISLYFNNISFFMLCFGVGAGNSIDVIGRESHNLFGLTLEMGFIWLIIYSLFIYNLLKKTSIDGTLFFMPILISGIASLLPITYMTFYYVGLLLIFYIRKDIAQCRINLYQ